MNVLDMTTDFGRFLTGRPLQHYEVTVPLILADRVRFWILIVLGLGMMIAESGVQLRWWHYPVPVDRWLTSLALVITFTEVVSIQKRRRRAKKETAMSRSSNDGLPGEGYSASGDIQEATSADLQPDTAKADDDQ